MLMGKSIFLYVLRPNGSFLIFKMGGIIVKNRSKAIGMILTAVLVFLCSVVSYAKEGSPLIPSEILTYEYSMQLDYTEGFAVDYYKDGYVSVEMADGKKLLLIPEDAVVPNGIEADIIVLQMPLSNLLVSNSPAVSLINAGGGVDRISMVTIERDSWYIEEVVDKMDENEIVFVGNYRSPDYEVIAKKNPPLTIIHTSVTPDNIAKFDELGLPYIVDASSNENYAMARVEWVKLYGALLGLDEEAQKVYDDQVDIVNSLAGASTGKTVAVFYITSKGPSVRNGGDYMAEMIDLAGGEYVLSELNPDKGGVLKMEAEEFYARCKDADYVLYIAGAMGGVPQSTDDLIAMNPLLADFEAVKNGRAWCTTPNFFQVTHSIGNMIENINTMLTTDDAGLEQLEYLYKLK